MRTFDPHLFWRGAIEPISLGVLGLIVTSIVIGTVAVIRTATFDVRQRARTYPTCPSYCLNDCTEQNDTLVCLAYCTENLIKDCTYGCQETTGGGVCKSAPPANVCTTSQTYRCNGATSEYCAVSGQPPASSTKCEFGCSDENGKCKVAQTCPSQCIKGCYPDNTCQAYCSSEMESECAAKGTTCNATLTGGVCNASPEPVQATGASCYYGDSSCANIGRYSASGCSSSCPVGTGLASCCSDLIPKAPIKVGDSCSQPHGQPVNGTIYCCNGTAQGGQCAGSVAHYLGQSNALPLHTWCEWGFIASCSRCPNGQTYSQNNKDYCGTAPPTTAAVPVAQPAVTYANPLENVIATIILSDPDYFASALQTADCGNASNTDIGKLFACNFMVTQARANVENNLQGELNRFGTWAPLLGIPAVILAAAEVGPAAIAVAGGAAAGGQQAGNVVYQHLLQFGQTSFGQSLTNFGNQLFNSTEGVIVQLGLERAFGIDLSIADFSYSGLQTTGAFQTNNPIFHNQLGESLIISTKYEGLLSRIAQAQNQSAPSNQIFSTTNLQFEIPTVSNSQFAKNFVQNIPAHILNDPELFEQYLGQQIKAAFPYYRSDTRQISILADKAGNLDTLVNMLDTGICTGVLCRQVAPIVY